MKPEALQRVLMQEQRDAGLYLEELDDDTLLLKRGDQELARFFETGATRESIRLEAQKYVKTE